MLSLFIPLNQTDNSVLPGQGPSQALLILRSASFTLLAGERRTPGAERYKAPHERWVPFPLYSPLPLCSPLPPPSPGVVATYQAPGRCPYCGGVVVAADVESTSWLYFVLLCFRIRHRFYCSLCSCRLMSLAWTVTQTRKQAPGVHAAPGVPDPGCHVRPRCTWSSRSCSTVV
jgi:hypothetical protein